MATSDGMVKLLVILPILLLSCFKQLGSVSVACNQNLLEIHGTKGIYQALSQPETLASILQTFLALNPYTQAIS